MIKEIYHKHINYNNVGVTLERVTVDASPALPLIPGPRKSTRIRMMCRLPVP